MAHDAGGVPIDTVAHVALQLGRLLLQNGSDTDNVGADIRRLVAAFGCEANLLVTYEALIVTIDLHGVFRTKIGHRVPGMNVGMGMLHALDRLLTRAEAGLPLDQIQAELDRIEHAPPAYPHWLVIAGMALTAASLSRLFVGDWGAFIITAIAGAAQTWFRLKLAARPLSPILITFAAALLGGTVGGFGAALGLTATSTLCIVVPGMILVPGVPLINGVRDLIGGHATLGVSRLGFASAIIVAIATGLFPATLITGVHVPIAGATRVISVPQDALFSALAAAGFAILFSVPARLAWACMLCGVVSHTLRTVLFDLGIDLTSGSLLGALAAGLLAQFLGTRYRVPAVVFAFPGVVAMIPGVFAFRAAFGFVAISHGDASLTLISATLSLAALVALMVGGIAVGVAVPKLLMPARISVPAAHRP